MAETRNDTGGPLGSGFKFNSTGRDDTSTEVMTPQLNSRERARRSGLIAMVVAAFAVLAVVSFIRSGFNPFKDDRVNKDSFGAKLGERKMDAGSE